MRPPASASESMRRLFVMKDFMRECWRLEPASEAVVSLDSEELLKPLHSGRKTGKDVMR